MRGWLIGAVLALAPAAANAQAGPDDAAMDARIRASAEAAQSLQGPLDGAWTLVADSGQAIYAFQIVDKAGGQSPLEGVWRDLRHPAAPGDIGLVERLAHDGDSLSIGFVAEAGQPAVEIELKTAADGAWTGELREAGAVTKVSLRRN